MVTNDENLFNVRYKRKAGTFINSTDINYSDTTKLQRNELFLTERRISHDKIAKKKQTVFNSRDITPQN